jgi:uncharacterized membrane-anchored protein YhcB (DUF1043 family)
MVTGWEALLIGLAVGAIVAVFVARAVVRAMLNQPESAWMRRRDDETD